jgi:transcriptional regulator with XRE-family HTH domain
MANPCWPQQERFREKVRRFCEANGYVTPRGAVDLPVVADLFNLCEQTLKQFLQYRSRSRPHLDTLTHIAGVLGCSVAEFVDDPGEPPPGMQQDRWAGLSEQERAYVSTMYADITRQDLSPAERRALFAAYEETRDRFLDLRKMWAGGGLGTSAGR